MPSILWGLEPFSMYNFAAIILAFDNTSGLSTDYPLMLHKILGKPAIKYMIDACQEAGASKIIAAVKQGDNKIKSVLGDHISYVAVREMHRSGNACLSAKRFLSNEETVLVFPACMPAVQASTLRSLMESHILSKSEATILSAVHNLTDSFNSACSVKGLDFDELSKSNDLKLQQLTSAFNAGIYCFNTNFLFKRLKKLKSISQNTSIEIIDILESNKNLNNTTQLSHCNCADEIKCINSLEDIPDISKVLNNRFLRELMANGVNIVDPSSVWIDSTAVVKSKTTIKPFTVIEGDTEIGEKCEIGPFVHLVNARLSTGVVASFCRISHREVPENAGLDAFENFSEECVGQWFSVARQMIKADARR